MPTCVRCGQEAKGSATIGRDRYCHDDSRKPSCYMLTLWEQPIARPRSKWAETLRILGASD